MAGWFTGPGIGVLNGIFLRLDCTNDPLTAGLEVNAATAGEPVLTLLTTDDDPTNPYLDLNNSGTPMPYIVEKDGTRFLHLYGTNNLFMGVGAGNFTLTGEDNICLGVSTGVQITTGSRNVAMGSLTLGAGGAGVTGNENFALGVGALRFLTSGYFNVAIGIAAGEDITTGFGNMCIGGTAGRNLTLASNCTAIGIGALLNNLIGIECVAIGHLALGNNTASTNVGIGVAAGHRQQAGTGNTFIGYACGSGAGNYTASNHTMVGYLAGRNVATGTVGNVFLGYQAGFNEITSNKLYIANTNTATPLIYGEFDNLQAGVNVGSANLAAAWHVDQPTDDAAIPVLLLDQADVDQDMIEFVCAIGVGNAIEAVGAKTLTVTHFIKVTLPGPLTRYIPVGTIA